MIRSIWFCLTLVLHIQAVRSGAVARGDPCSTANDHLDPATQKFLSQCSTKDFCSAVNGTCIARLCRRDEFPFGYALGEAVPLMCPKDNYCPDEGSGCKPWVNVGGTCQLGRDEQCAPPSNWEELSSSWNFNGSICLNSQCMYANVTLGQPCIIDNTTYVDNGADGSQLVNIITRDNCHTPHFYCDVTSLVCMPTKAIGHSCQIDQECNTYTCNVQGLCTDPPETPLKVAPWQYAITAICIVGAMVATCAMLTFLHKRHRLQHYSEIREYYSEQIGLRRSIIALHSAAVDGYSHHAEKAPL